MVVSATGPNQWCPCGSGKKYKKCCGGVAVQVQQRIRLATPEQVIRYNELLHGHEEKELARFSKFGGVNPVVTAVAGGTRFVRVGDHIWHGPEQTTFPEFLFFYLYMQLGSEWHTQETARTPSGRHVIRRWMNGYFEQLEQVSRMKPVDESGVLWLKPNGMMKSVIDLAYDLFTLRDHSLLQDRMLRRLKDPGQFQGARYEAFVTAAMIRAGFVIEFEDETDRTSKHPEFIATDKIDGHRFAIEAKSHHRKGVLGALEGNDCKLRIVPLINSALAKRSELPMIIFIDLNLPAHEGDLKSKPWFPEFERSMKRIPVPVAGGYDFAAAVFTNIPSHYSTDPSPSPKGDVIMMGSKVGKFVLSDDLRIRIHASVTDFANVPATFEEAM